jgi:lactate permease
MPAQDPNEGGHSVYTQDFNPVSDSLGLTAIFAVLPILTLFVLLGGMKMKAQWAALISLAVAMLVALIVYGMPFGQTALSASEGAVFGFFPIMWIVIMALWIYNMTVATGDFAVLRRSFGAISEDQRIQAVIIAFCFGALMEALAGFGTPVAISSVMLIGLGFRPIKAASVALVANTAPVAFGAIAIPIVTLSDITGLDKGDLGAMVGRQTPFLALVVPLILIAMVDGARGIRQTWPVAAVGGLAFAIGQFACSNYISVEVTDIVASLLSTGAIVALLQLWRPGEPLLAEDSRATGRFDRPAVAGASVHNPAMEQEIGRRDGTRKDSTGDVLRAYAPYVIIIAVLSIAQIPSIKNKLAESPWTTTFDWPGMDIRTPTGEAVSSQTFNFNWLPAAGTLLLISGLLTMAVLRVSPGRALRVLTETVAQLRWAIVTLGLWAAGAGSFFAFLSPLIGWLGVAVTGSDTSSNALFGALQVTAAKDAGIDQVLLAAGNSSGGVLGKMISPQNLAIGAAAVGMAGQEGDLFRRVLKWSLLLILLMCVLVYLQSTVLDWMVV